MSDSASSSVRPARRPRADAPNPTSASGRVPPHSVEAEEQLLSACLLDGGDVVARCLEGKIAPASFYVPANRVIYEKLLELYNSGKPIDLAVLAEELKTTRQLDEIGGYAYLTRISGRIPTTAGASYFIEKVRELALLREIIRAATGAVASTPESAIARPRPNPIPRCFIDLKSSCRPEPSPRGNREGKEGGNEAGGFRG